MSDVSVGDKVDMDAAVSEIFDGTFFFEPEWVAELGDYVELPDTIVLGATEECPDCNGRGEIELLTSWAECDECGGTGRV